VETGTWVFFPEAERVAVGVAAEPGRSDAMTLRAADWPTDGEFAGDPPSSETNESKPFCLAEPAGIFSAAAPRS